MLQDAARAPGRVIVAGDLNSHGIGRDFVAGGFDWPTEDVGASAGWFFSWDHVFMKGFRLRDRESVGVVPDQQDASDHHPVWAVIVPDPPLAGLLASPDSLAGGSRRGAAH